MTICPKCGTIAKSDKVSCCGRGGSWFETCGSGGNSNLAHTWSEGIRVCKARGQSKLVITQQPLINVQQSGIHHSNDTGMKNSPFHTSDSRSSTFQGCVKLLNVAVHISLLFTSSI